MNSRSKTYHVFARVATFIYLHGLTKVSFRKGWATGNRYEETARLLVVDRSVLIPSLAIFVASRNAWLCGKDAAQYRPKANDQVFENWKAAIFQQKLDAEVDGALDAAGHFFQWLADKLIASGVPVADCRVKICLPAFNNIKGPASILAQRMFRSGWSNVSVSRVEEPRANALGVFSEGSNILFRPTPDTDPNPVFLNMFGGTYLLEQLRHHILGGGPQTKTCAVLDVGSFTTDVSIVRVNALQDGDCLDGVHQASFPLGMIRDYEEPLLSEIGQRLGFDPRQLSFEDRENIKRSLEGRRAFNVLLPGDRRISLGSDDDLSLADEISKRFARKALDVLERAAEKRGIDVVILTGGGIAVRQLRNAVKGGAQSAGRVVLDLATADQIGLDENAKFVTWDNSGSTLERTATALGAGSILLDFPVQRHSPVYATTAGAPAPYLTCSCRGGNKDCMRCGGAGHYRRRGGSDSPLLRD